ncbi:hypothetical protein M9H77_06103 [Catharanthus roseus]|uniref:Uncharacterized protein n=1 Tax=Catharanthus roseus TaxID=4058 RepID=A0ACC0BRC1_CATRO|nr:hypothetical protein M9H77_06103 [Catharanthus roseus]
MNIVLPCAILAILLSLGSCDDLISNTCKQTPNNKLCNAVLRRDSRSRGADVSGLALIVIDAVKSQSNSILTEINHLLKTNRDLKVPLHLCTKVYKFILKYDISVANEAVSKGNPKFGEDAMKDAAINMAPKCEGGFKKFGRSPLTSRNKVAIDLSNIAVAIIRLLL